MKLLEKLTTLAESSSDVLKEVERLFKKIFLGEKVSQDPSRDAITVSKGSDVLVDLALGDGYVNLMVNPTLSGGRPYEKLKDARGLEKKFGFIKEVRPNLAGTEVVIKWKNPSKMAKTLPEFLRWLFK